MYRVTYDTLNDTYTKDFNSLEEAVKFCRYIHHLYPEQQPIPTQIS